jgi:hypothetical protein
MNKVIQYLFLILLPFYPLWAFFAYSLTKRNIGIFTILIFIPLVIYYLATKKIRIPTYLILFMLFTAYHLGSIFVNNLTPPNINLFYYILSDIHLLACMILLVVENTEFEDWFIEMMNKFIFLIVMLSLVVSMIQIKFVTFFVSPEITQNPATLTYIEQHRNFSIFSWININSLGVTFPILISILLSFADKNRRSFPFIILGGIIVSFLTKARYVMISTIIVISQLFFGTKIELRRKIYLILMILALFTILIVLANAYNYDIQQVISNRILEKRTGGQSAGARIASYYVFLEVFPAHPLFGVGPQTGYDVLQMLKGITTSIHIGYLSFLYFYGIFGFSLLLGSLFFLLRNSWIVGKKHLYWGSFYGFLSFCFANTTFTYFNFNEVGVVLAILYLRYYLDKSFKSELNTATA